MAFMPALARLSRIISSIPRSSGRRTSLLRLDNVLGFAKLMCFDNAGRAKDVWLVHALNPDRN